MAVVACNGFADSSSGADDFIQNHVVTTGAIHWVYSVTGSDSNPGTEGRPLASIAQAITNATANNGDIILVKSGHSETLTSAITVNKAGLRIFGIGSGTSAPSITVNAAIDGINVTADDVELNNIYFPVGTTAINTARVNVDADRARIKNCRFNCGLYDSNTITLTANASNCEIDSVSMSVTADGPDSGILIEGAITGLHIFNSSFDGGSYNWDDAAIYSASAHVNFRYETITLTNEASISHTNSSNKGVIGDLIEGDGSQVQV